MFLRTILYQRSLSHPQNPTHYYIDIAPDSIQNPDPSDKQTYLIVRMIMLEVRTSNSGNIFKSQVISFGLATQVSTSLRRALDQFNLTL